MNNISTKNDIYIIINYSKALAKCRNVCYIINVLNLEYKYNLGVADTNLNFLIFFSSFIQRK